MWADANRYGLLTFRWPLCHYYFGKKKKAAQSQKSGQRYSTGINLNGCTSFSETTAMAARRKSILVYFPFGYMRIPAVNTREQQKQQENAINLKFQHIKHILTIMTLRKAVLVNSLFCSCTLKVSHACILSIWYCILLDWMGHCFQFSFLLFYAE